MAASRRNSASARAHVGLQMLNAKALITQLEKLDFAVRESIAVDSVQVAMRPIQWEVMTQAPASSGSREKQSAKSKAKWAKAKPLKTTIKAVVRKRKRAGISAGVLGLVGPSYSDGGGHGNLFAKDHKKQVLWGTDSGFIRRVNQFVKKAADMSRHHAEQMLTTAVKNGIQKAAEATTNG